MPGEDVIQKDLLNVEIKVQKKIKSQEVETGSSQDISVVGQHFEPHRNL